MLTTKDRIKLVPTQISTSQYWFDSKGYKWIVIRPMSRNRRLWEVMQQSPTQDNFFRMTSHEISTRINEYNNIPMSSISIQFDTSGNKIVEIPDSILKSGKYNESETINQLRQMTSLGGQITSLVPVGNEHTTRSEEHTSELQSHHDLVCR